MYDILIVAHMGMEHKKDTAMLRAWLVGRGDVEVSQIEGSPIEGALIRILVFGGLYGPPVTASVLWRIRTQT